MTANELCGRMNNDVGSMFDRTNEVRSAEGVVVTSEFGLPKVSAYSALVLGLMAASTSSKLRTSTIVYVTP